MRACKETVLVSPRDSRGKRSQVVMKSTDGGLGSASDRIATAITALKGEKRSEIEIGLSKPRVLPQAFSTTGVKKLFPVC